MTTDRELLELAAKAEGRELSYWSPIENAFWCGEHWNPLADDGAALRLAVKLNLSFQSYPYWDRAQAWHPGNPESVPEEMHNGDPYAATRRAIIRAAAEIGKAMP